MYDIYAKTDAQNRITDIRAAWNGNSVTGMTLIGQQSTAYAQEIYCPNGLFEEHGVPLYTLEGGTAAARAQAEIDADIAAIPAPQPTQEQINAANIEYIAMMCDVELEV